MPLVIHPRIRKAVGRVAALHRIAEVVQDLRDARHADAADADEMDRADGKWEGSHEGCPVPAKPGHDGEVGAVMAWPPAA